MYATMEKVPVLLFDMISGDRELIFASGTTLFIGLGGREFRLDIDMGARMNIAIFDEIHGRMDLIGVHDPAKAQEVMRAKFEEDILSHTIFCPKKPLRLTPPTRSRFSPSSRA